jgi:hypothetical protein
MKSYKCESIDDSVKGASRIAANDDTLSLIEEKKVYRKLLWNNGADACLVRSANLKFIENVTMFTD